MFLSELILYLILFSVSVANLDFDARQLTKQYGPAVCPYTNFCYVNATEVLEDTTDRVPCCAPCSCEDTCWELGNCCPDKHHIKTPDATCDDSMTKTSATALYRRRYFVVGDCPAATKNATLVERCKLRNKSSIEDYMWVSDKTTGKIFGNKYCALCNGVPESSSWRMRTTCTGILTVPISEAVEYILSNSSCGIINESPERLIDETNKYACHLPQYTKCNQTGAWGQYVENIDIACNAFTSVFLHYKDLNQGVAYKNMFCYVCNTGTNQPTLCSKPNRPDRISSTGISFSALLQLTSLTESEKTSNTVERGCGIGEIMDTFTVCVMFFCFCEYLDASCFRHFSESRLMRGTLLRKSKFAK